MVFKPLPWMTFFSIMSLFVLYHLGAWQYEKFDRKSTSEAPPPIAADTLRGETLTAPSLQLYGLINSKSVWRQVQPVQLPSGEIVFAALSIHPGMAPLAPATGGSISTAEIDVIGWLRPLSEVSWFGKIIAPVNTPEKNIFHTVDMDYWAGQLPASQQSQLNRDYVFEPFELPLIGRPGTTIANPYALLDPDPLPPERHLGYAWTWWGIALALIAIYFAYHHKEGRLRVINKT